MNILGINFGHPDDFDELLLQVLEAAQQVGLVGLVGRAR